MKTQPVSWMSGHQALQGEVQRLGAGIDGAGSADLGGHGGPGGRAGRHHHGGARDKDRVFHRSARPPGTGGKPPDGTGPDPAPRGRPQEDAGERSDPAERSRRAGGAHGLGPPDVAAALALEEGPALGGGPPEHGPPGQPTTGGRAVGGGGLQSAGQPQDARGTEPSGPRPPVSGYQPAGPAIPSGDAARHLRRYEEEGTGRGLQERGATGAPAG